MQRTWVERAAAVVLAAALAGILAADRAAAEEVPAAPATRRIVVSIPDRLLAVIEDDRIVDTYAVAVGAPATPSPIGTFTIVNRLTHPTYYRPGKIIAAGPRNPLGTRWIGLSVKGYGIHGTDSPQSIGQAKSMGCIRLRNSDVERLFERVRAGDVVELHAARPLEIARYLEESGQGARAE